MKKILLALVAVVMFAGSASAIIDKYTIDRSALPTEAQSFLDKYFPKAKVSMIKVDKHLLKKTDYDVKLVNGTKIEFNSKGAWTSVDCKNREVPQDLVPAAIRRHVKNNFDNLKITEIEKKPSAFEITLSDGVELKYDRLGIFKGVIDIDHDD